MSMPICDVRQPKIIYSVEVTVSPIEFAAIFECMLAWLRANHCSHCATDDWCLGGLMIIRVDLESEHLAKAFQRSFGGKIWS